MFDQPVRGSIVRAYSVAHGRDGELVTGVLAQVGPRFAWINDGDAEVCVERDALEPVAAHALSARQRDLFDEIRREYGLMANLSTASDAATPPALAPGGFDLEITTEERAAIANDGTCDSLLRYFRSRSWDVGGFVNAVLSNDLLRALNNRGVSWEALDTIRQILNRCPPGAFGSYQRFDQWTTRGRNQHE